MTTKRNKKHRASQHRDVAAPGERLVDKVVLESDDILRAVSRFILLFECAAKDAASTLSTVEELQRRHEQLLQQTRDARGPLVNLVDAGHRPPHQLPQARLPEAELEELMTQGELIYHFPTVADLAQRYGVSEGTIRAFGEQHQCERGRQRWFRQVIQQLAWDVRQHQQRDRTAWKRPANDALLDDPAVAHFLQRVDCSNAKHLEAGMTALLCIKSILIGDPNPAAQTRQVHRRCRRWLEDNGQWPPPSPQQVTS